MTDKERRSLQFCVKTIKMFADMIQTQGEMLNMMADKLEEKGIMPNTRRKKNNSN